MKTFATWSNYNVHVAFEPRTERIPVEVMAEVDGHAMVRRKGHTPFVVATNDLSDRIKASRWPS